MPRAKRTAVSVWTLAPMVDYTDDELNLACHIHSMLDRGTLILAPPRR